MTRKDYELIARVLAWYTCNHDQVADEGAVASSIAEALADELAQTDPRFDRARFLKACGVDS